MAAQEPNCDEGKPRIVGFVIDAGTESPLASALVWVESSPQASLTTDSGPLHTLQLPVTACCTASGTESGLGCMTDV